MVGCGRIGARGMSRISSWGFCGMCRFLLPIVSRFLTPPSHLSLSLSSSAPGDVKLSAREELMALLDPDMIFFNRLSTAQALPLSGSSEQPIRCLSVSHPPPPLCVCLLWCRNLARFTPSPPTFASWDMMSGPTSPSSSVQTALLMNCCERAFSETCVVTPKVPNTRDRQREL